MQRIEIISILASEVGILGNAPPPTEIPFASYCEFALSHWDVVATVCKKITCA